MADDDLMGGLGFEETKEESTLPSFANAQDDLTKKEDQAIDNKNNPSSMPIEDGLGTDEMVFSSTPIRKES